MLVYKIRLLPKRKVYIKIKNLKSWNFSAKIAITDNFLNDYKNTMEKNQLYIYNYQDEEDTICGKLLFKFFYILYIC